MTKSEKAHLDRVAAIGCILCWLLSMAQSSRTELHHPRMGTGKGQKRSDWTVVPLCGECHRGECGVHGDQSLLRLARVDELDLLGLTIQRVYG